MKEEFEYGELVEVREYNSHGWKLRHYVATVEFPDTDKKLYLTHLFKEGPGNHEGDFDKWRQIRKIQKPEPDLIDIEQRMDKFEAILNGAIKQINEQVKSIKKQLK